MFACEIGRVHAEHRDERLEREVRLRARARRRLPSASYSAPAVPGVTAEPAELLGPAVAHPSTREESLLKLLLHRRDVDQFEREALTLLRHQVVVVVEPGREHERETHRGRAAVPRSRASLPNT